MGRQGQVEYTCQNITKERAGRGVVRERQNESERALSNIQSVYPNIQVKVRERIN